MSLTLESLRELYNAVNIDDNGRYYAKQLGQPPKYGYNAQLTGAYVCFTCGHLCDCGEVEEIISCRNCGYEVDQVCEEIGFCDTCRKAYLLGVYDAQQVAEGAANV